MLASFVCVFTFTGKFYVKGSGEKNFIGCPRIQFPAAAVAVVVVAVVAACIYFFIFYAAQWGLFLFFYFVTH